MVVRHSVRSSESSPLGRSQIGHPEIGQVFSEAKRALALDRSLFQTPVTSDPLEIFMRLRLSNWMRRVWTLLEGIMANPGSAVKIGIHIQLQDGVKEIHALAYDVIVQEDSVGRAFYSTYSNLPLLTLKPMIQRWNPLQTPRHSLAYETLRAIRRRATSWRQDETLCMASILKLDGLDKLLDLDAEDFQGRMIWFLRAAGSLPVDILFQPCQRLSVTGFRWAPVSFLSCFANTSWQQASFLEPGSIRPDKHGFLFARQGLRLVKGEDTFPLIGEDFLISHNQSSEKLYLGYFGFGKELEDARNSTNIDGSRNLKNPAIILGHTLTRTSRTKRFGILVDIFEERKGRVYFLLLHHQSGPSCLIRTRQNSYKAAPGCYRAGELSRVVSHVIMGSGGKPKRLRFFLVLLMHPCQISPKFS